MALLTIKDQKWRNSHLCFRKSEEEQKEGKLLVVSNWIRNWGRLYCFGVLCRKEIRKTNLFFLNKRSKREKKLSLEYFYIKYIYIYKVILVLTILFNSLVLIINFPNVTMIHPMMVVCRCSFSNALGAELYGVQSTCM